MKAGLPIAILAGGEGRRIGGGKALRLLAGSTLIDRALAIARSWSSEVLVMARQPIAGLDAPVLPDESAIAGPLGGLVAALRHARASDADRLLTLPCDMPFLPNDLPDRLGAGVGDAQAALAMSGSQVHPVCGLWRLEALDSIDSFLASGRRSLRGFAEAVGCVAIEWACDPIDPFFNVNSADDLAWAEAVLAERA